MARPVNFMKILMINDNYPLQVIGGAESYLRDIQCALQAQGHVVHVVALSSPAAPGPHRDYSIRSFDA